MMFKKELKIGIFVVVVLVASFFVINYLRGKDIFGNEMELVAYFDDVDGLASSAPVFIKGYKAGKVSEVLYLPEKANFKVTCSILKEFAVPEDSKMTIYATDLMGSKGVKIELGESEKMVADGGNLEASFELGMVDRLVPQVEDLLASGTSAIDSLSVVIDNLNMILGEDNQKHISNTLNHLERTMKNVSSVASTIQGRSDDLNAFITNLTDLSVKLNSVVEKIDGTVEGVSQVVDGVVEADIKSVIDSFHALLKNINDPDGTIGKLIHDGSVYKSLDELLVDIDILVKKIQENPKKYMKLSVF